MHEEEEEGLMLCGAPVRRHLPPAADLSSGGRISVDCYRTTVTCCPSH